MASADPGRSLICDVCSRTFGRYEHLQRHSRTHTKEKPYICRCGRSFARKDLLTRHERLNHSHAGRRSSSPPKTGSNVPVTRSSDPKHEFSLSTAVDGFPNDHLSVGPNHQTSASLLAAAEGDPLLDYARLLNAPEFDLDGDSFVLDTVLNRNGMTLSRGGGSFPQPSLSPMVSPTIPDDTYGDDDFRELKPVRCPWLISESSRMQICDVVGHFAAVLPPFIFPSRLAIARYVSGYVDGFSHHHPFIHIPTLKLTYYLKSPEFILAIFAIGAQYRYETKTAFSLYQASRAVVLERQRRGDFFCPHQKASQGAVEASPDPGLHLSSHEWMDRIRTLLLLFVYTSWQNKAELVQQAFEYQSVIARCLREIGLSETSSATETTWLEWARNESDRRTKQFGWCLLSLHGLAFDTPPPLLSRELNMFLPSTCREWLARNQAEWEAAKAHRLERVMFRDMHAAHLATGENAGAPPAATSPMANYILIHALLQRIYLTRQLSQDAHTQSLAASDIVSLELALNRWRHTWRASPGSILDLHNPYRSLAFTSTALLGMAHIRLHCNLGQWRNLQSCNPNIISATLEQAPGPQRGPQNIYAVLHSVHALNIPVQIGLSYYSHCKSYSWSIQHALCNIECATFLSKWLLAISSTCTSFPLSALESQVVQWIGRVVREALLSHDDTISLLPAVGETDLSSPELTTRKLSYGVVKVWAQMFKFCNSPWPIVRLIGQSLDQYAALIQGPLTGNSPMADQPGN